MESPASDPLEARDKIPKHPIFKHFHSFLPKTDKHLNFKKADWGLFSANRYPRRASLMFVSGPTGVGKKSYRQKTRQELIRRTPANSTTTPAPIPVVKINTILPGADTFNWHDYYIRVLSDLADHCTNHEQ